MTSTGRWIAAWPAGAALAVANGVARDLTYGRRLGEQRAHQVSTLSLVAGLAGVFAALQCHAPLPDRRAAARAGAAWVALTVAFEVALGRGRGLSWREQLADYDLPHGRLWPLVLLWLAVGPRVVAG